MVTGWAAPLAIADAPLALLAIAGLLFGVWVMSRGPRATGAVAAPPGDDAPAPTPAPTPAPAASPFAPVAAPEPEPELEELPRTTFRQGTIKLVGSTPDPASDAPEPEPEPDPAPPAVPPTTFRQGRIRLQRGPDEPPDS